VARRIVDNASQTEVRHYYGTDHLGSTVLVTGEAGEVLWTGETNPFGDSVSGEGLISESERIKYTGKDFDEDAGLYYFNARWYDPATGRFISEDPIRYGANWYGYANNNPLMFVDPTGLMPQIIQLGTGYLYTDGQNSRYFDSDDVAIGEPTDSQGVWIPVHTSTNTEPFYFRTGDHEDFVEGMDTEFSLRYGERDRRENGFRGAGAEVAGSLNIWDGDFYLKAQGDLGSVKGGVGDYEQTQYDAVGVAASAEAQVVAADAMIGLEDSSINLFAGAELWSIDGQVQFEVLGHSIKIGGAFRLGLKAGGTLGIQKTVFNSAIFSWGWEYLGRTSN
jgi:RHS repeat-associated protein